METSTGAGQLSLATADPVRAQLHTLRRRHTRQQPDPFPPAPGQPDPGAEYRGESPIYAELVRQWHQHGRQTPRPATATPLPPDPGGALFPRP